MRLETIERPRGIFMRLAYRISLRQFGKVLAPLKVIYARKPRLLALALHVQRTMEHGLSLDPTLRLLVQTQAARRNGCAFCEDLALAQAVRARLGREKFDALDDFRTSGAFTDRERAALAFTEEATGRHVSDGTWAELRRHFGETEVVELAWLNAAENYFNLQAHALGIGSDELLRAATADAAA
jgi:alkylhydroperoxidase family enzyme